MRTADLFALILLSVLLPCPALCGSSPSPHAVGSLRPTWSVGDWWSVESQVFDRGDKRPGGVPGWLAKETWGFSVVATNSIEGELCYQVAVRPKGQNLCPYWFCYWFRQSDLLVMRRELHQPVASKSGRPSSVPIVQTDYVKEEETPFDPSDFPHLPLTVPHFVGGLTNVYGAKASPAGRVSEPGSLRKKSARLVAGSVTQTFHPNERLEDAGRANAALMRGGGPVDEQATFGVLVLARSEGTYERQNWHSDLPWHTYGEKWERGLLVRKSWLVERGRPTSNWDGLQNGGR